jgi:hypothetical protein
MTALPSAIVNLAAAAAAIALSSDIASHLAELSELSPVEDDRHISRTTLLEVGNRRGAYLDIKRIEVFTSQPPDYSTAYFYSYQNTKI